MATDTKQFEIKSQAKGSVTVRTARGRLAYAQHVFTPGVQVNEDGSTKSRYSVSLLIPKSADMSVLNEAIEIAAAAALGGADYKKRYPKFKSPILATADYPIMGADASAFPFFIRTSADPQYGKPGVVDHGSDAGRPAPVTDPSEVYSGRWAMLTVNVKGYDKKGNRGVTCYLNNVQVLEHDESLSGGRRAASDDFESVPISGDASEIFQ